MSSPRFLGHSGISITADVYGHIAPDVSRSALDILGAALTHPTATLTDTGHDDTRDDTENDDAGHDDAGHDENLDPADHHKDAHEDAPRGRRASARRLSHPPQAAGQQLSSSGLPGNGPATP